MLLVFSTSFCENLQGAEPGGGGGVEGRVLKLNQSEEMVGNCPTMLFREFDNEAMYGCNVCCKR